MQSTMPFTTGASTAFGCGLCEMASPPLPTLSISAEALYVQAGILDQRHDAGLVADAVLADEGLTERQKQVLLEIYDSFRKENAASSGGDATVSLVTATTEVPTDLSTDEPEPPARAPRKRSTTPRKRTSGPAASA